MTQPSVSVIMPVYNTARYVEGAIDSVLSQTFTDLELLIIDDAGSDNSIALCQRFTDRRIRIISQNNRGLAGARNTGIRHARGEFVALLDSDDLWEPAKLERHIAHLRQSPNIGISYAASHMIDDDGAFLSIVQSPKLRNVTPKDIFLRNPIGNGSAPVIRKAVFDDIETITARRGESEYFDESFKQSEDIECWMRIALTTKWRFEGIKGAYTRYRINEGGLSANVICQFETWLRMRDRVILLDPTLGAKWARKAEAYQLRYLARRCIRMGDGSMAWTLMKNATRTAPSILWNEPIKSITSFAAAAGLRFLPAVTQAPLNRMIQKSAR